MMSLDAGQPSGGPIKARLHWCGALEAVGSKPGDIGRLAIKRKVPGQALTRGGVEVVAVQVREQNQLYPSQDVIYRER
jgi:hypothetical protein